VSDEVLLHGGLTNAGRVTRVGDTVRRPPSGAASWALLVDDRGREMLSFRPGEAAIEPIQDWVWTDEALVSVAELLRRYHDAAASFDASGLTWPDFVPARFRDGLVCHNDPNLDNVIFAGGVAVGLIDFDLASPGCTAWDVACAARLWAPLRDELDLPGELRGRTLERLRMFADAYGLARRDRRRMVDAVLEAHERCYRVVGAAVDSGHERFGRMWRDEGGSARADRTREWIALHGREMRAALG
jgi:hypothetical protein